MAVTNEKGFGFWSENKWLMGAIEIATMIFGAITFFQYVIIVIIIISCLKRAYADIIEAANRVNEVKKKLIVWEEEIKELDGNLEKINDKIEKVEEIELEQRIYRRLLDTFNLLKVEWQEVKDSSCWGSSEKVQKEEGLGKRGDKLRQEKDGISEKKENLEKKKARLRKEYVKEKRLIKTKINTWKKRLMLFWAWVVLMGFGRFPKEITACGECVLDFSKIVVGDIFDLDAKKEKKDKEKAKESKDNEREIKENENKKQTEIDMNVEFWLDNADEEKCLESRDNEQFFVVDSEDADFSSKVYAHIKTLLHTKKKDTYNTGLEPFEEADINDASSKENEFKDAVEMAKEIRLEGNYEKWKEALPCSTTLEQDIMLPRIRLAETGKCNANLAFLIANNYQQIALEYQRQGKDDGKSAYFYVKSVIWISHALEYDSVEKESYFRYLKARYRDLKEYGELPKAYQKYQDFASKIYDEMKTYQEYN